MLNATKAALLSALVFPGAGHFLLKKYITGVLLATTSLAALYLLIAKAVEKALKIAAQIQSGEVQLDVIAITELVSRQTTGPEARLLNIASTIFIIIWLIGIIDSYRVGRRQDKEAQETVNS